MKGKILKSKNPKNKPEQSFTGYLKVCYSVEPSTVTVKFKKTNIAQDFFDLAK